MMYKRTDGGQDYLAKHPPHRISAGKPPAQPPLPETVALILLQSIKAAHTSEHHDESASKYRRGSDGWLAPGV